MIKTLEKGSIQAGKNHFYLANLQGEFHMHLIYWQSNKADASFFKAAESQRPLLPNVCLAIFLKISLKSAGTNHYHPTTPQTLDEVRAGNQIRIQIW